MQPDGARTGGDAQSHQALAHPDLDRGAGVTPQRVASVRELELLARNPAVLVRVGRVLGCEDRGQVVSVPPHGHLWETTNEFTRLGVPESNDS